MKLIAVLIAGLVCLSSCAERPEADWLKGETGEVARILDGDTLALNTGLVVRLVSVEAPQRPGRNRAGQPYGDEAAKTLERLALGRPVELFYPGMTEDRYERALAQVFVTTEAGERIWLNQALIEQGAAWVRVYADTAAGSEPLWDAEEKARRERTGLWEIGDPLTSAEAAALRDGVFSILDGELTQATMIDDRCLSSLVGADLKVYFDAVGSTCEAAYETPLEIRGWARGGAIYVGATENLRPISAN